MDIYHKLIEYSEKRIPQVTVTVVSKKGEGPVSVGKKMLVSQTGETYGTVGGGAIEYTAIEYAKELLKTKSSDLVKYVLNEGAIVEDATTLPMICGGTVELFYEYVGAMEYITIFGGGHVGQALTKVLKTMNFHVTVVESRRDVLDKVDLADRKVNMDFADFIEEEGLSEDMFVVVATPSHKYDFSVMHKVFSKKLHPKYIGMLCSKEKLKDFLDLTYETFGKDIDLSNFYSPIGLATGGGSPEEIAISISAEILAVSYKKKGHKHLSHNH